ncbi:hypothetical protein [Malacoplasma muris]|uniref:hypothetical protein n=1 Tax=Malacoplasma muris TaxID=2119 RepID=UPI00398EBB4A
MEFNKKKRRFISLLALGASAFAIGVPTIALVSCSETSNNPGGDSNNPGGDSNNPGGDSNNPGGDSNNPGTQKKKVQSLTTDNPFASKDGNYLFHSYGNTLFGTWSKTDIKNHFGNITWKTDNKNRLSYTFDDKDSADVKSKLNILQQKVTADCTQANSTKNPQPTIKFANLNLTGVTQATGSNIRMSLSFDNSDKLETLAIAFFLNEGYEWTNGAVQDGTNGWDNIFEAFAKDTLKNGNPSGYYFTINKDDPFSANK